MVKFRVFGSYFLICVWFVFLVMGRVGGRETHTETERNNVIKKKVISTMDHGFKKSLMSLNKQTPLILQVSKLRTRKGKRPQGDI